MNQLRQHDEMNAEGDCQKCGNPLDISGQCSTCAFEDNDWQEVVEKMRQLAFIISGEGNVCPHCGQQVTAMHQRGRDVYGSCGCRIYQGRVPKSWQNRT